jgi:hypothetical protein
MLQPQSLDELLTLFNEAMPPMPASIGRGIENPCKWPDT